MTIQQIRFSLGCCPDFACIRYDRIVSDLRTNLRHCMGTSVPGPNVQHTSSICNHCCEQILTHMKEKLQFVEGENEDLQQQLGQLESELAGRRDELAGLKANRDKLRQQGRKIKETNVYVSDPMLLHDMQVG